jgi:transcriptional regulator with XRE-family HTH domain
MEKFRTAEEFGALLRGERKRRGYTQVELAEFAGVGVSYVINIEHGKPKAEIGKALHLAELLSLDLFASKRGEE